jgi:hypothetical protein
VSLKVERDQRDKARKLLVDSIDPSENRKAMKAARVERGANSFEVVAREWLAKHFNSWVENHANRTILRFERDIFPWVGVRPISELLEVVRRRSMKLIG